jgi:hypothetical protein
MLANFHCREHLWMMLAGGPYQELLCIMPNSGPCRELLGSKCIKKMSQEIQQNMAFSQNQNKIWFF